MAVKSVFGLTGTLMAGYVLQLGMMASQTNDLNNPHKRQVRNNEQLSKKHRSPNSNYQNNRARLTETRFPALGAISHATI